MANREACELYIEQEIKAGLEEGKKPYSIGKELSAWIEKMFEVSMNPETIKSRAYRIQQENGSNEPNTSIPSNDSEKENNKEISKELTAKGEPRKRAPGAGRPSKTKKRPPQPKTPKEQIFEDRFKDTFDKFFYEIQNAKMEKWKKTTKEAVLYHISLLTDLITIS